MAGPSRGSSGVAAYLKKQESSGTSLFGRLFDNPVVQLGENLVDDVKDSVIGIPTGLVMLAKDPIEVGKAIGRGYWHDYSPLFQGDFKKFGKQVYDHPLGPILDILSIATLGAGATASGASALTKAGVTGARIEALANPVVRRTLRSGHPADAKAYVEHTKGYARNPIIRARQQSAEKAMNHLAGLLPSWFKIDPDIPSAVGGKLSGAERGDAWRWFRAEKFDEADRRHAAGAAGSLAIAGTLAAAKRLRQSPSRAAQDTLPGVFSNLRDHAHLVKPEDLPVELRREMTDAEVAKAMKAEERRARQARRESGIVDQPAPTKGTDVVPYDPATAAASAMRADYSPPGAVLKRDPDAPVDDTVDSIGVELNDVEAPRGRAGLSSRYVFVHKDGEAAIHDFLKRNPNMTVKQLTDFIANRGEFAEGAGIAGKMVTSDWRKAARDADGNFLVARNHAAYLEELNRSTTFLAKLGRGATTAWKWAILGMRPAYLVNNAVGNYFMYFVSQGPQGLRGLMDAMRQLHSQPELTREMRRAESELFRMSREWQDRYYMGLHRGYSADASHYLSGETVRLPFSELQGKKAKFVRVAGSGLYDVTHRIADRMVRRAAINTILRKDPEVRRLMKGGMHFDGAAAAVSENRAVREAVQQQVNDILGQYHYLNGTERAIRAVVPFYTWDRAIARHGAHLYLDRPTTAAAMTALGELGVEKTEEMLGQIPDFLRGALPLSMIGMPESVDGRIPILGTAGVNPYSSLDSLIKAGQALTTGNADFGEVAASQLHPGLTGLIEQMTGQKLLSGARLSDSETSGGALPNVLTSILGNLPQARLIDTATTGPDGGDKTLYPGDFSQHLLAFLGFPAKRLNPDVASQMQKRGR